MSVNFSPINSPLLSPFIPLDGKSSGTHLSGMDEACNVTENVPSNDMEFVPDSVHVLE